MSPVMSSLQSLAVLLLVLAVVSCDKSATAEPPPGESGGKALDRSPNSQRDPRQGFVLQNTSPITLTPKLVKIGPVGHKQDKKFTFTVRNPTDKPVKVDKVKPSCGCIRVAFKVGPLGAGEERQGIGTLGSGVSYGSLKKYVTVHLSDAAGKSYTEKLAVLWDVHPTLERPKKRSAELHGYVGGESPDATDVLVLRRKASGTEPLTIKDLSLVGRDLSVGKLSIKLHNTTRDQLELIVKLSPSHAEGLVRGTITGTIDGHPIYLTVKGMVFKGLRPSPRGFQFGQMLDPVNTELVVELTAVDGKKFEIKSAIVEPPNYEVDIDPRPGGGFLLTARPIEPFPEIAKNKPYRATVHVVTTHPDKPTLDIRILGIHVPPFRRQGGR